MTRLPTFTSLFLSRTRVIYIKGEERYKPYTIKVYKAYALNTLRFKRNTLVSQYTCEGILFYSFSTFIFCDDFPLSPHFTSRNDRKFRNDWGYLAFYAPPYGGRGGGCLPSLHFTPSPFGEGWGGASSTSTSSSTPYTLHPQSPRAR